MVTISPAERMRQEQEAAHERAEQDKRNALREMADRIEADAGVAVQQIGDRTGAMTATAQEMQTLAERTGAGAYGMRAGLVGRPRDINNTRGPKF